MIRKVLQYWTAKKDKFSSSRSRFFSGKWTLDSFLGRLKTSKNTLAGSFSQFLGLDILTTQKFAITYPFCPSWLHALHCCAPFTSLLSACTFPFFFFLLLTLLQSSHHTLTTILANECVPILSLQGLPQCNHRPQ
jgi:hypothetical protein